MKKVLLAGLASLAGAASLYAADVTSVNIVGYGNLTVPPGFSMVANQFNTSNNTIGSLLPSPPVGTRVFKWTGSGFAIYDFTQNPFTQVQAWVPNANATLNPGEGAFIFNPSGSSITVTFVGEVPIGDSSNSSIPAGFSIISSTTPQSAGLSSVLGFPVQAGDRVFRFNGSSYTIHDYTVNPFTQVAGWTPSEPVPNVGEAFFSFKASTANWVRNFQP